MQNFNSVILERHKISPWEIAPGAFVVLFWRRNDGTTQSATAPPPKLLEYIYHKTAEVVKQIFLFWGLIFKTDVDKIKSTTGDGTQEGSGSQSAKRIRI